MRRLLRIINFGYNLTIMASRWVIPVIGYIFSIATTVAQTKESFDIISYVPPKGWARESADYVISFVKTNANSGGWCRINIYQSQQSSGEATQDFKSEWKDLVFKNYPDAPEPSPDLETADGWTSAAGVSKFTWQKQKSDLLLTTISGYGKEVSFLVLMNNQEFMSEVEKLFATIQLQKPEASLTTENPIVNQPQTISISESPGNNGITLATTNFDDGWVAQPMADYVKVSKGEIRVFLHYPIKLDDEIRNSNDIEATLFDRLILPRYKVSNIRKYDNGGPCYFCIYFFEAEALEIATGKKFHLGFRVITNNGISRCIEIVAPNVTAFMNEFSKQERIASMLDYNKFALSVSDLVGEWEESSGAYVDMYNTVTGTYAGMNTSSSSNSFIFNQDNSYQSNHKGAFGMVGNMKFYDQKYNGKMTVTNWDMTLTNRFEGKTDIFWGQFEAVKGGRVLHLTDKNASGIQYHLVKTK